LAVPPHVLPLAAPAQALLLPAHLPLVWRVPGVLPLLLLWRQGDAGQQDGQDLVLVQILRLKAGNVGFHSSADSKRQLRTDKALCLLPADTALPLPPTPAAASPAHLQQRLG
jgi:hypothetical protein